MIKLFKILLIFIIYSTLGTQAITHQNAELFNVCLNNTEASVLRDSKIAGNSSLSFYELPRITEILNLSFIDSNIKPHVVFHSSKLNLLFMFCISKIKLFNHDNCIRHKSFNCKFVSLPMRC